MKTKLSPIERLIDKACGFNEAEFESIRITLRCPRCKNEKRVLRDASDPTNACVVQFDCPECSKMGGFESPAYFDKDGKEILPYDK